MATGVVSIDSELVRKKWMREGLVQAASKSFWAPFMGSSKDAIVYQVNNQNAADGHTVVFDFDGNLSGKAIKGKDTAYGKGEQKKKFSDKITVERYRLVVDNGDVFDGTNIGDLSINQHGDSRAKLGDLWTRFKDQSLFDAGQGFKDGVTPTHKLLFGGTDTGADLNTFGFDGLIKIEKALKTGMGYATGAFATATAAARRRPLEPFRMDNGQAIWLFAVDAAMATVLKTNAKYQTLLVSGDVRGNNNRVINGVIGKLGQLLIVEADVFFGATTSNGLNGSEIEISGLRQYDGTNSKWTGESGFDAAAATMWSRGLILGKGALQLAMGKQPDYKFKGSQDFDIKSESAVEFWMETQATKLTAENGDYSDAKVAGITNGIIPVDVKL